MWIAANWETLGRFGRFGLLQALVLAAGVGAAMRPAARAPLGLLALLGIGALFAYFGQTYQTGADAWQLFALWAALALPLCLGARSDVLWAPWALVAMTAIALWTHTHSGHRWSVEPHQLPVHLLAWAAALLMVGVVCPALQRFSGASVGRFVPQCPGRTAPQNRGPALRAGCAVAGRLCGGVKPAAHVRCDGPQCGGAGAQCAAGVAWCAG
ncbi:MAG: DUF2157 domain-containing protein [Burkholderiales bacterium]|nr:DUF2157 domain-containing protein [Burkholderiales bacterium]